MAPLAAAAALATAARYESLFLVAAAVVALAATKRGRAAWAALLGGALPPALYGVVSVAHGWPPLPSSVLLKGAPLALGTLGGWVDLLGGRAAGALVEAPHVLVLVGAALALAALRTAAPAADRILAAVFAAAALLHLELAAVGWLYRYEAYLVALGLVVVVRLAFPLPAREPLAGAALAAAVAVLAVPLGVRAISALRETPRACRNIYEQQYQMGLFLRAGYPGGAVMANDIGAVAFLADVRLLDLYGLATRETARARRQGTLDRAFLERATEEFGPDVIVIYRSWFADALPAGWIEVGTWRVPEKVVVADRTVSFFAPGPEKARRLAAALAAFQPELPASVVARMADAPAGP